MQLFIDYGKTEGTQAKIPKSLKEKSKSVQSQADSYSVHN